MVVSDNDLSIMTTAIQVDRSDGKRGSRGGPFYLLPIEKIQLSVG